MKMMKLASSGALVAALAALPFTGLAMPASAAGESTPGVTVTATNPGNTRLGSDLKLTLTAHSESSTLPGASCRPENMTLDCWGSLVLRIPKFGDVSVGDFQVHRVAVGDISCVDESGDGGGCGDEGMVAAATVGTGGPVLAQVNGVGVVKWSGNSGLAVGTKVQLKFTLTDNGNAPYGDQVVLQMNLFANGSDKPLLYQSPPETVRQVQIHYDNGPG